MKQLVYPIFSHVLQYANKIVSDILLKMPVFKNSIFKKFQNVIGQIRKFRKAEGSAVLMFHLPKDSRDRGVVFKCILTVRIAMCSFKKKKYCYYILYIFIKG